MGQNTQHRIFSNADTHKRITTKNARTVLLTSSVARADRAGSSVDSPREREVRPKTACRGIWTAVDASYNDDGPVAEAVAVVPTAPALAVTTEEDEEDASLSLPLTAAIAVPSAVTTCSSGFRADVLGDGVGVRRRFADLRMAEAFTAAAVAEAQAGWISRRQACTREVVFVRIPSEPLDDDDGRCGLRDGVVARCDRD